MIDAAESIRLSLGQSATWMVKGKKVRMGICLIPAAECGRWLEESGGNNFRSMNLKRSARYCASMVAGAWDFNGATIVFDSKGRLVDGQKRLKACSDSGVAMLAIVIWGLDASMNYDRPELRTLPQYLAYKGEKVANRLAATIRAVWDIGKGQYGSNKTGDVDELVRFFDGHRDLSVSTAAAGVARGVVTGSMAATLHYFASRGGMRSEVDKFLELVGNGVGLTDDDPIYLLRRRMDVDSKSKARLMPIEKMALLITAWNGWAQGRPMSQLRWARVGPTAQPFPEIWIKPAG